MIKDSLIRKSVEEALKLFKINEIASEGEKAEQERIANQISSEDAVSDKKSKKKNKDEAEKEDLLSSKKEKKKEDEKTAYKIPEKIPGSVKFNDIIKQLNFLRSGASTKDDEVKKNLLKYFEELSSSDKKELFTLLSGFATIITKKGTAEDAPSLGDMKKQEKSPESEEIDVSTQKDGAPIVVGEVQNVYSEYSLVLENNSEVHRCANGKVVPFGSDKCIEDITARIEDISFSRDASNKRSEARTYYNGMLKYLRMQLRAANKLNGKK